MNGWWTINKQWMNDEWWQKQLHRQQATTIKNNNATINWQWWICEWLTVAGSSWWQWWWQGLMATEKTVMTMEMAPEMVMSMARETETGKATATPSSSIAGYSKSNTKWQLQHHGWWQQAKHQAADICLVMLWLKQHHDVVAVAFAQLLLHRKWQWELLQLQQHCSSSSCTARDSMRRKQKFEKNNLPVATAPTS